MRAVLDTSVLVPGAMRALLLAAAERGHLAPVWSPRILGEWQRVAARQGEAAAVRAEIEDLGRRFPGASVEPLPLPAEGLAEGLPDPADAHVLGAALAAGAGLVVTRNARDFPRRALARLGLRREDPDPLLAALAREDPGLLEAARAMAAARGLGPRELLRAAGLPRLGRMAGR